MENRQLYLNDFQLMNILSRYKVDQDFFFVPTTVIAGKFTELMIMYYLKSFSRILNYEHNEYTVNYLDNQKKFVFVKRKVMAKAVTFTFDYGEYNHYLPVIFEINKIISNGGMVEVFANNDIYRLSAGIIILEDESKSSNLDEAKKIAIEAGMTQNFEIGREEVLLAMSERQYNCVALTPPRGYDEFKIQMKIVFLWAPKIWRQ